MRLKDKIITIVLGGLSLFSITQIYAQQDPQYTQYMYNANMINPAYAGSRGTLNVFGMYRTQWVGLDG
ncbi:type IX secretion system membrane protein PorP/SprF, partial [Myroides odoratimimus]|uniref:type IX secretion system membrane protein PorP/SprF n=1 Tax=Myroides odoratimimus TaxID=76832 RepID=UPI003100E509